MKIDYKSGIGYFNPEKATIITEEGNELKLYDCKVLLILNKIQVNGKEESGKCLYIPINEIDIENNRFTNDYRFRHREYMYNTLKNYTFGDGNNVLHEAIQKYEDGEDEDEYESFIIALTEMGIGVWSNLEYGRENFLKQGGLYIPTRVAPFDDSQMEQIRNMLPVLKKEFFRTGVFVYKQNEYGEMQADLIEKCWSEELMNCLKSYYGEQQQTNNIQLEEGEIR